MSQSVPSAALSPEVVSLALNEQGFLFQQRILQTLREKDPDTGKFPHSWYISAAEVPVSVPGGEETRIDIVLNDPREHGRNWNLVLECKRAHPDFKAWIFFDARAHADEGGGNNYHLEYATLSGTWDHNGPVPMMHLVDRRPASDVCPLFNYYLESRLERPDRAKPAAATKAIEDAFQQVTLAQTGIARHLRDLKSLSFRLAPIVVTTAQLAVALYNVGNVSQERGMIDPSHLKVEPRDWLAVNYRINDSLVRNSGLTTNVSGSIREDLQARQIRTIFVVQALALNRFLAWFQEEVAPGA